MTLKLRRASSLQEKTSAFDYQRETIDSIKDLDYSAIFLEQGLGKTKVAIDLSLYWLRKKVLDTVIIVTKKGLVNNWCEEFSMHSHVTPRILGNNRTENHSAMLSPARIYITNYETIKLEEAKLNTFCKLRTAGTILDESQKIKNPNSGLTECFLRISDYFVKRVIMTGTPIANRPYDIWSQIYFLDKGKALGSEFDVFKKRLDLPESADKSQFIDSLEGIFPAISKFTVRLTKEKSGLQLPFKEYIEVNAEWEFKQADMYKKVKKELAIEVLKDGRLEEDNNEAILKRLLRLVQISSNPALVDDAYDSRPGKLSALLNILEQEVEPDEKAIVWTSFVDNALYLRNALKDYGAVMLHGQMDMGRRQKSITKFKNESDVRVLVATPAAAKEGLTLTVANHVIYYDRGFSLDDYLQSQDRIHRISQTRTCYVHNIILPNSIDHWIGILLNIKERAASYAMGESTTNELESILDFNLSDVLKEVLK